MKSEQTGWFRNLPRKGKLSGGTFQSGGEVRSRR
jgi:hypothetical protein